MHKHSKKPCTVLYHNTQRHWGLWENLFIVHIVERGGPAHSPGLAVLGNGLLHLDIFCDLRVLAHAKLH